MLADRFFNHRSGRKDAPASPYPANEGNPERPTREAKHGKPGYPDDRSCGFCTARRVSASGRSSTVY
jgi:hypothetical protein